MAIIPKATIKHFVNFLYIDARYGIKLELEEIEITTRDQKDIKLPVDSIGYVLFDKIVIDYDGEKFIGKPKNREHYIKGEVVDIVEAMRSGKLINRKSVTEEVTKAVKIVYKKENYVALEGGMHVLE